MPMTVPCFYFVSIENYMTFINKYFIVIIFALNNIQGSGFGMTLSFYSVLKYCGVWQFFLVILRYLPIFLMFRTPQCPALSGTILS